MKIGVAILTFFKLQFPSLFSRDMAFIASNRRMFSVKRISRFAMIEFGSVGNMPAIHTVAIHAVCSELSVVYVGMAVGALIMRYFSEFSELPVI